jgi:enamine deaminase RidA (YjgF/YER057c/UK114 family)
MGPSRRSTRSGSPFEDSIGFSRAIRLGGEVAVSGTTAVWPDGTCDPDPAVQARRCFAIIEAALTELGCGLSDVIRTRMYLVSAGDADAVGRVHGEIFATSRPAATMVIVAALLDPRWRVEIEVDARAAG